MPTRLWCLSLFVLFALAPVLAASAADEPSWAESVKLPESEKPIKLFNGKDLSDWEGQIEKYWSVDNGTIRAKNTTAVPVSTYLFTKKSYRNFRLLLEVKQSQAGANIHSAVALLGEKFSASGDPFSFKGPLVMFLGDWGYYEVNGRNRVFPPGQRGTWKIPEEKLGEWNRLEIVIKGEHIRCAVNGKDLVDFQDKPELLKSSPIGLQLHKFDTPQEYWFRGLILTENPEDKLLTVAAKP